MRHDTRFAVFATAVTVSAAALAFVWLVLATRVVSGPGPAVGLAAGLAVVAAFLAASAIGARRMSRARTIADVGRRYALGDLSRPGPDYGDDEVGVAARALDVAVHEQERRIVALARDRARMEAILASMVEGVLVVDESGRLQLVNDAARRMLKVDRDAVGRSHVEAIRHPGVTAQIGRVMAGQAAAAIDISISREGVRDLTAHVAPVAGTGRGVVVVLHDVSDIRRTDQIRRDFVANVSHELRTPLTAIRGYAEALMDDSDDPEARQRFLGIIHRHVTRMERLVKDLLRLAMLDAGKETLETAPTDVAALVGGIVDDVADAAAQKRLRIVVDVATAAPARVDAAKVHDILRNLVENAVNYTPDGGTITVSGLRTEDRLTLRVEDTGPGIPPNDLDRVFERFYRVDKSRGRPGGTGLGLAIVKHLTELHGGSVQVANRSGGGAAFEVMLPLVEPTWSPVS